MTDKLLIRINEFVDTLKKIGFFVISKSSNEPMGKHYFYLARRGRDEECNEVCPHLRIQIMIFESDPKNMDYGVNISITPRSEIYPRYISGEKFLSLMTKEEKRELTFFFDIFEQIRI